MQLRDYQQECISQTYKFLRTNKEESPCIVLPTGAGKTPVIAQICKDAMLWGKRVIVVAHVRELLEQAVDKLCLMCPEYKDDIGVYSAGLKSRDTDHRILVCGIQSVYKRADELGTADILLVDEAHLIPNSGMGMYQRFITHMLAMNPAMRIVGLTATPYRLDSGPLCTPDGILNRISYEVGIPRLISDGYLCNLRSKAGNKMARASIDELHRRGGEFIDAEVQSMMDTNEMVRQACANIVAKVDGRNKVLVFCCGVSHGQHVAAELERRGEQVREVYGDSIFREQYLEEFKTNPDVRFMVNCNVLTVGFDYPAIDGVVLLRPTLSPGLYYQMVGRGLRVDPRKDDCLILDYGENILRHGPIVDIDPGEGNNGVVGSIPSKECPNCSEVIRASFTQCPSCKYEFIREPKSHSHEVKASDADILGRKEVEESTSNIYKVWDIKYSIHNKKGDHGQTLSQTVKVEYHVGLFTWYYEWLSFDKEQAHPYAYRKAKSWWKKRSTEGAPETVSYAMELLLAGKAREPERVRVDTSEDFPEIKPLFSKVGAAI